MNLLFAKQNSNNRSPVRVIHVQYPTVLDRTFHRMKQTFRNKPSIYISRFRFVRYLSFLSFFFFFHLINKIQKFQKSTRRITNTNRITLYFYFFFFIKITCDSNTFEVTYTRRYTACRVAAHKEAAQKDERAIRIQHGKPVHSSVSRKCHSLVCGNVPTSNVVCSIKAKQ